MGRHKLALVQMKCEKAEVEQNLQTMREYIAESRGNGADFVIFPEMNITGYINPEKDRHAVLAYDHPAVVEAVRLSGLYSICVIAGFVERNPGGKPFITQFAAHDGALLGFYRKKTIKEGEELWFSPGNEQPVFTVFGLTFGLSVCADIDDPLIFAEYAKKGATLVMECAAPGLYGEQSTRYWASGYNWWRSKCIEQLGTYAANQSIEIAVATQAGRTVDEDFPGGGYLFNGQGVCAAESGNWSEGIFYVEVDR